MQCLLTRHPACDGISLYEMHAPCTMRREALLRRAWACIHVAVRDAYLPGWNADSRRWPPLAVRLQYILPAGLPYVTRRAEIILLSQGITVAGSS